MPRLLTYDSIGLGCHLIISDLIHISARNYCSTDDIPVVTKPKNWMIMAEFDDSRMIIISVAAR